MGATLKDTLNVQVILMLEYGTGLLLSFTRCFRRQLRLEICSIMGTPWPEDVIKCEEQT